MRHLLFIASVLVATAMRGQAVLPLLYTIPPTAGCNGVAAFLDTTVYGCGGGGPWTMEPMFCSSGPIYSGDTLFIVLCAFPCEVTMLDGMGNACICGTGVVTTVPAAEAASAMSLARVDGGMVITAPRSLQSPGYRVYTAAGQLVQHGQLGSGMRWTIAMPRTDQMLIVMLITGEEVLVGRL